MKKISLTQLNNEDKTLVMAAREATNLSYAPYSNFHVGAAVLLSNGEIVKGGNQENASYPVGICAERSVLSTAQNIFPNVPIKALALTATNIKGEYTNDIVTPCGMCRQAIAENEKRYRQNIRIIMSSKEEVVVANSINNLLPLAFS